MKQIKPLSSVMTAGRQRKKVTTKNFDEKAKFGAESVPKIRNVNDVIPAVLGALQPEPESAFQLLEVALRKNCFVKNTSLHKPDTDSALQQNVGLVRGGPLYSTRSAWYQTSSDYNAICKADIEDAVQLLSKIMNRKAHILSFCSYLMFFHYKKAPACRQRW